MDKINRDSEPNSPIKSPTSEASDEYLSKSISSERGTPDSFSPLNNEALAASKIQAKFRGMQVRKAIVPVQQLQKRLEKALGPVPKELGEVLAKEVANKFTNPTEFEGHGKRLFAAQNLKLPCDLWAKKTARGIEFELIGNKLGEGTGKKAFKSQSFEIDLSSSAHDIGPIQEHALIRSEGAYEFWEGWQLVAQHFKHSEITQGHLVPLPTSTDRRIGTVMEYRNELYKSDMGKALEEGQLEYEDIFKGLGRIAEGLELFHSKGLIHGDVQPGNIWLDKQHDSFLADYDLVRPDGASAPEGPEGYMDALSLGKPSRMSPLRDCYALAKTSEDLLFAGDLENASDLIRQFRDEGLEAHANQLTAYAETIRTILDEDAQISRNIDEIRQLTSQQLVERFPGHRQLLELAKSWQK